MNSSHFGQQPQSREAEPGRGHLNVKSPRDSTPGLVPAYRPGLGSRFPPARCTFLLPTQRGQGLLAPLHDPLSQDLIPLVWLQKVLSHIPLLWSVGFSLFS